MQSQIIIDPEFRDLIPPLRPEERQFLEESILAEGLKEPLSVWQKIILDGYNRYEICLKHHIPIRVEEVPNITNREEAMNWIRRKQLGRRNLSDVWYSLLRGQLYESIKKASGGQEGNDNNKPGRQEKAGVKEDTLPTLTQEATKQPMAETSPPSLPETTNKMNIPLTDSQTKQEKLTPPPVKTLSASKKKNDKTARKIASETGVNERTVRRDAKFAKELTEITKNNSMKPADLLTNTTITRRDVAQIVKMPPETQQKVVKEIMKGKVKHANSVIRTIKDREKQARKEVPQKIYAFPDRLKLFVSDVDPLIEVADESVDWIITDPPYRKDDLSVYASLAKTAKRVLKTGGSCLVMSGQSYLPEVMASLSKHLQYHWTIAYLTPGGQAVQLWGQKINSFWKPVLWFTKGEYRKDWIGDVVTSSPNNNDKLSHKWGQSENGMYNLIQRLVSANDVVLDPFLGGGTTAIVVLSLPGCLKFIGSDIDPEQIKITQNRIEEAGIHE